MNHKKFDLLDYRFSTVFAACGGAALLTAGFTDNNIIIFIGAALGAWLGIHVIRKDARDNNQSK